MMGESEGETTYLRLGEPAAEFGGSPVVVQGLLLLSGQLTKLTPLTESLLAGQTPAAAQIHRPVSVTEGV